MLIWGQANPEAMQDNYHGVYLNSQDMKDMVSQIEESKKAGEKIPVLIEHAGGAIGHVVSAWVHNNTLQCVLELQNKKTLESSIGEEFVRKGVIKELSLGYFLDIQQTKQGGFNAKKKFLREISLVKKGAREKCKIWGITSKHPIQKK